MRTVNDNVIPVGGGGVRRNEPGSGGHSVALPVLRSRIAEDGRRVDGRGRPPVWRRFSYLRVHGTFLSRVPVRHATVLMPSPIIPISCPRGREPDAPGEREKLGTGKSRVPADKNVGATTSAFANKRRGRHVCTLLRPGTAALLTRERRAMEDSRWPAREDFRSPLAKNFVRG
jgi:hypothetical protein